jgi:hypothetical protein
MQLDDLLPIIPFVIVIALFVLVGVIGYFSYQNRLRVWQELAERNGLQMIGGSLFSPPRLEGHYRGRPLKLYTYTQHSGKHSHTYTIIAMQVNNPAAFKLSIFNQGLLIQIGKALGMQDIEIGDSELDRRFVFRGQPEAEVQRLLLSISLRQKLLETSGVNLSLEGQTLKQTLSGAEANPERLQFFFNLLADLADGIDRG